MQLTQEDIDTFKQIYKEEYGEELSDAEARDRGMRLLRIVKAVVDVCGKEIQQR